MEIFESLLTKEECETVIKNALNGAGILVDFKIRPFADDMIGYLGEYFKLICVVKDKKTEIVKSYEYFLKSIPVTDEIYKDFVTSFDIFPKESGLYTKLFTEFQKYEIGKWRGQCYYARNDLLVLEDLTISGYRNLNENEKLTHKYVKSALRCVARMHANSIVYEQKTGINIENTHGEYLKEISVSPINGWLLAGMKGIKAVAKIHPKYQSPKLQTFIDELLMEKIEKIFELVRPTKSFCNVFSHRDVWGKNMLFKIDDENLNLKTIPECVFVDFQLCRYSPPALDTLFLIHLNMTRKERESKEMECLRYYYEYLEKYCSKHEVNLSKLMTWNDFLQCCEYFRLLPLVLNGIYAPFLKLPENYFNDLHKTDPEKYNYYISVERSDLILEFIHKDPVYKNAIFEIIEDVMSYVYE